MNGRVYEREILLKKKLYTVIYSIYRFVSFLKILIQKKKERYSVVIVTKVEI